MTINEKKYTRKEEAGFVERVGVTYYKYLAKNAGIHKMAELTIEELPPDDTLRALTASISVFSAIIAFTTGALTTVVTIWVEWTYINQLGSTAYYLLYGSVLVTMLIIEMTVLYWLGLKSVHSLSCLTGHHRATNDRYLPGDDTVPNILARAALEVPDPVINYLGIDPLKYIPKYKLLLVGLLYKAKVVLSSFIIKNFLIRFLGKGAFRWHFTWVPIPVTGIWDAFVMYKVTREARLRLFGNRLAQYMANDIMSPHMLDNLSPKAREGAIRAVATIMVLTQNYHPNMLVLLVKLSETFVIKEDAEYDNWEEFLQILSGVKQTERYFILDLLSVAAAFDGHISRLERHYLPQAFGELTDTYMHRSNELTKLLLTGQLHAAKKLCKLDFNPG